MTTILGLEAQIVQVMRLLRVKSMKLEFLIHHVLPHRFYTIQRFNLPYLSRVREVMVMEQYKVINGSLVLTVI